MVDNVKDDVKVDATADHGDESNTVINKDSGKVTEDTHESTESKSVWDRLSDEKEKSSVLRSVLVIVTAFVLVAVQIPVQYLVVKTLLMIALVYVGVFSLRMDSRDYKGVKGKSGYYWLSLTANVITALAFTYLMVRVSWIIQYDNYLLEWVRSTGLILGK
jgi:hypothetical protein